MASFNIAINCPTEKDAENLFDFIGNLEIYTDGLDISEDRVSVISKQTIIDDIKKYFKSKKIEGKIEIWPEDTEYDDAESSGDLESIEITLPKTKNAANALLKFKAYSGQQDKILAAMEWLKASKEGSIEILETWEPAVEFGSYGIIFTTTDKGLSKALEKSVSGIVTEKAKQ